MSDPVSEPVYEMLWDCPSCRATKNLGLTHRHCPSCGAEQDASRRYFPSDAEKIAVADHPYVGVDRHCQYCNAHSSRAAKRCGNCGAPLDEAKDTALVAAPAPVAPAPSAKKRSFVVPVAAGCGVLLLAAIALAIVAALWKRDAAVEVVGHSWKREIEIEKFGPVEKSDWCDELPSGAKSLRRHREVRSHKEVPDGEECTTKKVDRGNGTFIEKRECQPKTKKEPVYEDKCDYEIDKWSRARTLTAAGESVSDAPRWPDVKLAREGACVGCEREATRKQEYTVRFSLDGGKDGSTCDFEDEAKWRGFAVGSRFKGAVSVIGASLDCGSLQAQ